jgi:hypothetical protein
VKRKPAGRQLEQQTLTYTNRKGVTYVLCRTSTSVGRNRYVFAREPRGQPVDSLPLGYVISESVNGVVSLTRDRPPAFPAEEVAVVEAAVRRHPKASLYRVAARPDHIAIYERLGPEADDILAILGDAILPSSRARADVEETLEQGAQYTPVLRFRLVQAEPRMFGVQRRWYSGSGEQWLPLATTGPLSEVIRQVVPVLGTDQFFELW